MKITKSQLRQIIKEEVQKTMDEGFMGLFKGGGSKDNKRAIKFRVTSLTGDNREISLQAAQAQAEKELKAGQLITKGNRIGMLKSDFEDDPELDARLKANTDLAKRRDAEKKKADPHHHRRKEENEAYKKFMAANQGRRPVGDEWKKYMMSGR